ncbi:MAG: DUF1987 domain-containing protein [Bacteroidales bacterium]|jgi:hypothetical protein|nr:DUF1987 domain-containing protein [Bacteroidales bacterium]
METTIKATNKTPEIIINSETSEIFVKGILIPENPLEFFNKINLEIDNLLNKNSKLILALNLQYFNTGATKYLFELFKKLKNRNNVKIIWYYESDDEDIYESGKEFQSLTNIDFEFIEM